MNNEELDEYVKEAQERWGNTEAYKQSQERYGKLSGAEKEVIKNKGKALMQAIADAMTIGKDATDPVVQTLIDKHYNSLRVFYDPSLEIYKGLAEMYVTDPRFIAYYEKYAVGLAQFMHDAIIYYVGARI